MIRRFFAIELETLARRAFIDIDISTQLHMVCDRFIDGQVECALRRHLDSLGPDTPMADIVDCCQVWESHRDVETEPRTSADRRPARAICQVTEVEPTAAVSPELETVEDMIKKLLPKPSRLQAVPIRSDQDLLIRQLMEAICPPTPGAHERSPVSDLESLLLNWLPVGIVTEEDCVSPEPSADSVEGCSSCGGLTHTTDQCRTQDQSFPFLPTGWQAEYIRDKFILVPGPPPSPRGQQTGNADLERGVGRPDQ